MHLGENRGWVLTFFCSQGGRCGDFLSSTEFPAGYRNKISNHRKIEGLYGEERERFDCSYNSLRGRRFKGNGKGVFQNPPFLPSNARAPLAFPSRPKSPFPSLSNACHAGYS